MSHSPRVLFLSNEAGGAATYQAQQIEFLIDHDVDVALCDESPEHTLARLSPQTSTKVQVIQAPLWSDTKQASRCLEDWWPSHGGFVAISNPGIVAKYASVLFAARRQHGFRLACTLHSGMLVMTARRYALEWAVSFLYPRVDCISYVSSYTRSHWQRRYPWMKMAASQVVHNGVTIPNGVEPRAKPEVMRVGFVGRLSPEKDPELFCRIASAAYRNGLPMRFHIWGDGSLFQSLNERFPNGAVHWRGSTSDIGVIYDDIDALLMTSPVENCPYALLEARSFGVPVISAAVGGIPEIVEIGKNGLLARNRTVKSLLDGLTRTHENYATLSRGCVETRYCHAIEVMCKQTWQGFGLKLATPSV